MRDSERQPRFRYVLLREMGRNPVKVMDILWHHSLGLPVVREITLDNGFQARVVLPDVVAEVAYLMGDFESDVTALIRQTVQPGTTAFDIGAHFGVKSAYLKEAVGKNGRVVAFEPIPRTFDVLKINSQRWDVQAIQTALSKDTGYAYIQDFGWKYSGLNTLGESRHKKTLIGQKICVPVTTVDNFVAETGIEPNMMKIDAENSEFAILVGAIQTISECRPYIIFEAGDEGRREGEKTDSCLSFVRNFGYKAFGWRENRLVEIGNNGSGWRGFRNLLLAPQP